MIEYAYDLDATSYEISNVVSMHFVEKHLALVTSSGVLILIENRKVCLSFRFTSETNLVQKAIVFVFNQRWYCLALISEHLLIYDIGQPK